MVDRILYPTVSYLPFYYIFFEIDIIVSHDVAINIVRMGKDSVN